MMQSSKIKSFLFLSCKSVKTSNEHVQVSVQHSHRGKWGSTGEALRASASYDHENDMEKYTFCSFLPAYEG